MAVYWSVTVGSTIGITILPPKYLSLFPGMLRSNTVSLLFVDGHG